MRIIAITPEAIFNNESEIINEILESGVDYVHVRTPKSSQLETISMIKAINPEYYSRLALASHYSIFNLFPFGGVHIKSDMSCNSYNNVRLSKSYHCGDGLDDLNEYSYAFLALSLTVFQNRAITLPLVITNLLVSYQIRYVRISWLPWVAFQRRILKWSRKLDSQVLLS